MQRRQVLITLATLLGTPLAATAQSARKIPRIGFVVPTSPDARRDAFLAGLRELGYVEGRNLQVETRFAHGRPERLASLIDEVLGLDIDVLVVGATVGARAAKQATSTIPVVFAGSSDPVAGGIVSSLARPEGNITGLSFAASEGFAAKWLELLNEAVPDLRHVAVLWSSSNPAAARFPRELSEASLVLKLRLDVHHAANAPELDGTLDAIRASAVRGLIITPSPFAATQRAKLVRFAAKQRLAAMYFVADFVEAGGLMSYGPSITDTYRRAAGYVDKILNGAKPADLPIEQSTKYDLTVNLKTAKALGLELPRSVLLRVDRVVE